MKMFTSKGKMTFTFHGIFSFMFFCCKEILSLLQPYREQGRGFKKYGWLRGCLLQKNTDEKVTEKVNVISPLDLYVTSNKHSTENISITFLLKAEGIIRRHLKVALLFLFRIQFL